jgi:hypothetical protein
MFRTNARKQRKLWQEGREIQLCYGEWVISALASIALLAPVIRSKRRDSEEAAEEMLWTVGQCVSLGDHWVDERELGEYAPSDAIEFSKKKDQVIRDALDVFGVKECVLDALDRLQAAEGSFYCEEQWDSIRKWWVQYLA